jgi:hypothetical protein
MPPTGMTKANDILDRLSNLSCSTLYVVFDVAKEYADCPEICGKIMPAGNRLMRQLELAMTELQIP